MDCALRDYCHVQAGAGAEVRAVGLTVKIRSANANNSAKRLLSKNLLGDMMSTEARIRSYILENFLFTDVADAFADNDSFLERGIIDSTGVLELIFFVEEQFNIKVADKEMVPENFDSVDNIARFVQRKQAA